MNQPNDEHVRYKFASIFPTQSFTHLPEFLKPETIEGVMPDEVLFFSGSGPIVVDQTGDFLYIKGTERVDKDNRQPDHYEDKMAILKLCKILPDGTNVNGFIADLRHIMPGDLWITDISEIDDDGKAVLSSYGSTERFEPLLAAVFTDPDGNLYLTGEPKLGDEVRFLLEQVDQRRSLAE